MIFDFVFFIIRLMQERIVNNATLICFFNYEFFNVIAFNVYERR